MSLPRAKSFLVLVSISASFFELFFGSTFAGLKTELEKEYFSKHWSIYLQLIEQVAFEVLDLHKLFVYAFDLRPHLFKAIEVQCYFKEARLKEHCLVDNKYIDVLIYSKPASYGK